MWLFLKFLEAMGGQQPTTIIMDQDPAMTSAIKQVLNKSTHRFCMWHILKKVSEKVGVKLFTNPSFQNRFQSCVWESETPEEFEGKRTAIIRDFELDGVEWLTFMYGMRDNWIPAYFMDTFLARMRST